MSTTLQIITGPRSGETLDVTSNQPITVGRGQDNGLSLKDSLLSRAHARFEVRDDTLWLIDLGSSNGTLVNDELVTGEHQLAASDRIRLGVTTFQVVVSEDGGDPETSPAEEFARLKATAGILAGREYPLPHASLTLGRSVDNDIMIDDTRLSRHHMEIHYVGDSYWVRDLQSSNGTFLNGNQLLVARRLNEGDVIEVGDNAFTVIIPSPESAPLATLVDQPAVLIDPATPAPLTDKQPQTLMLFRENGLSDAVGYLSIVSGILQGEIVPIQDTLTIGRGEDCTLVLKDEGVSAQHSRIDLQDGKLRISDLGSRNRTLVNGEAIAEARELRPGDRVRIGIATLVFTESAREARALHEPPTFPWKRWLGIALALAVFAVVLALRQGQQTLSAAEIDQIALSVVQLYAVDEVTQPLKPSWAGSGTILSEDGQILTNCHVACDAPRIVVLITEDVETPPVPRYLAEITSSSDELDLAVLQIVADMNGNPVSGDLGLPALSTAGLSDHPIGDSIYIFGYPRAGGLTITVTQGSISGIELEQINGVEQRAIIKTDARVSSGNSGGSAVDGAGNLIGVPTSVTVDDRTNEGVPLIRPVTLVDLIGD